MKPVIHLRTNVQFNFNYELRYTVFQLLYVNHFVKDSVPI